MIRKVELGPRHTEIFAEPTPLGLIGLAIGCAALVPVAFGYGGTSPAGLETAAIFCLAFGAGAQFLAGMMNFANKNLFGGTVLTAFSFNWLVNWWALHSLAKGLVPDADVILATEVVSLVIFVVLTYGFGFFSRLLFLFLLDIDLLYLAKIARHFTGPTPWLDVPVGIFTVLLGLIALWIAFAALINPTAGRPVFRIPGPLFSAPQKTASFDWTLRHAIHAILYEHWRAHAFKSMAYADLERAVQEKVGPRDLAPDLHYLAEYGTLLLSLGEGGRIESVRLNAPGIDLYEQLAFRKYEAA